VTSRTTVLTVVIGLLLFALLALIGACVLVVIDKKVPPQVWSLAAVSVGALGSLLVSTSSTLGPNDREAAAPTAFVAPVAPPVTSSVVAATSSDGPQPGPTPQGA
jgi:hypothetical protein